MSKIKTSLRSEIINRLPVTRKKNGEIVNAKMRPQESVYCVTKFGGFAFERGGKKVTIPLQKTILEQVAIDRTGCIKRDITVKTSHTEYDNPDKPDVVLDADNRPQWNHANYSNIVLAKDYATRLNYPTSRKNWTLDNAKLNYAYSLRLANICPIVGCKRPIRVKKAEVAFKGDLATKRDAIYATVYSHFEVRQNEQGRFYFAYVDGTKRDIRVQKGRFGLMEFCDSRGNVLTDVLSEYVIENRQCKCQHSKLKSD